MAERITAPQHPAVVQRSRIAALRDRGNARTPAERDELLTLLASVVLDSFAPPERPGPPR